MLYLNVVHEPFLNSWDTQKVSKNGIVPVSILFSPVQKLIPILLSKTQHKGIYLSPTFYRCLAPEKRVNIFLDILRSKQSIMT